MSLAMRMWLILPLPAARRQIGEPDMRHTGAMSDAPTAGEERALTAMTAAGLDYRVVRHGRVSSLAEAAVARGVEPCDVIKTIVVRRADDDFLFVLVPGDRTISWPKLRTLLGVSRLSMPDASTALTATGYERGTITPFGSTTAWPVIADERVSGREVSLGAGAHGVAAVVDAHAAVRALGASVADVTDPE
jgi:Cys-tRNA(Pro)/Cys-tRNA(Cys) deacylase